jgi:type IV pilus assembly protein PilA
LNTNKLKKTKYAQTGLSLLKIMVLAGIAGILAEIALLAYQDHVAREQVTKAYIFISKVKSPITKFFTNNGIWPTKNQFNSLIPTQDNKYISTISPAILTSGFQVTATFKKDIGVSTNLVNSTIVLATNNGQEWICDDLSITAIGGTISTTPSKYRLENCH